MTVIVWDGTTLAADRQLGGSDGTLRTGRKIHRLADGSLVAFTGGSAHAAALLNWITQGGPDDRYPQPPNTDNPADMYMVKRDGSIFKWEGSPWPVPLLDLVLAAGGGGDFARGALAMGADAVKAVEIACTLDSGCGMGIDSLSFD